MNIHHVAIWADDIERLKDFYVRYFRAVAGERYHNPVKGLTSYFLTFPDGGAKLEIMNIPGIVDRGRTDRFRGFCHVAVSVGSREKVDKLTETMCADGVPVIGHPRTTGDGFYESVIADPEGNLVEITM